MIETTGWATYRSVQQFHIRVHAGNWCGSGWSDLALGSSDHKDGSGGFIQDLRVETTVPNTQGWGSLDYQVGKCVPVWKEGNFLE